jgi:hypothetical protein
MKLIIILSLFLASCATSKQHTALHVKTITYAKIKGSGSIVKISGMRRKYYLPEKYNVGDTVKIYFLTYK